MTDMKAALIALLAGLVFGVGLYVSQMVNPAKVLGFLDVAGNWDPSLAFVMVGAIAVTALGNALARTRPAPLAATARIRLEDSRRPGMAQLDQRHELMGELPTLPAVRVIKRREILRCKLRVLGGGETG